MSRTAISAISPFGMVQNWFTPDTPLLKGTQRARLIELGELTPKRIAVEDINSYEKISLINAMIDLGEVEVGVGDVFSAKYIFL